MGLLTTLSTLMGTSLTTAARRLKRGPLAGVREMVHDFQTFGEGFPEAVRGTAKLCEHLRSVLGQAVPGPAVA